MKYSTHKVDTILNIYIRKYWINFLYRFFEDTFKYWYRQKQMYGI